MNKPPVGFAKLTPAQRSEIATKGGRAAWEQGRAHSWTTATATEASKKSARIRAERRLDKKLNQGKS